MFIYPLQGLKYLVKDLDRDLQIFIFTLFKCIKLTDQAIKNKFIDNSGIIIPFHPGIDLLIMLEMRVCLQRTEKMLASEDSAPPGTVLPHSVSQATQPTLSCVLEPGLTT